MTLHGLIFGFQSWQMWVLYMAKVSTWFLSKLNTSADCHSWNSIAKERRQQWSYCLWDGAEKQQTRRWKTPFVKRLKAVKCCQAFFSCGLNIKLRDQWGDTTGLRAKKMLETVSMQDNWVRGTLCWIGIKNVCSPREVTQGFLKSETERWSTDLWKFKLSCLCSQ